MHCLPAHRDEKVTPEVIDGPQSVVIEQAENRLHLQKALMAELVVANVARRGGRAGGSAAREAPPVPVAAGNGVAPAAATRVSGAGR